MSGKTPMKMAAGPGMGFIANPGLNEFAGISPPNQRYNQEVQAEDDIQNVIVVSTPEEQRAL